jgi:hypothetical protein
VQVTKHPEGEDSGRQAVKAVKMAAGRKEDDLRTVAGRNCATMRMAASKNEEQGRGQWHVELKTGSENYGRQNCRKNGEGWQQTELYSKPERRWQAELEDR